ncbi:DUF1499 domain-containing protein, partial [Candidatus Binatia bacterium]|nr:DUF1499 domain-containing protein [Candidatus Binatia bacterium]
VLGMLAGTAVILGPVLGWLRVVPALVAFALFALGGLVAVVTGLSALIASARGRGFGVGRSIALLAGAIFLLTAFGAGGAPRINDFTTNLADPPTFVFAATLPANAGRDLAYPAEFAESQRACCADLHAARIAAPADQALQRAERVAADMPTWTITQVDGAKGTIEAVSESKVFGFQDDIVIRVRPDGAGSIVDVRSKSRDGKGDMGVNAARIRAYVAALEQSGAGSS